MIARNGMQKLRNGGKMRQIPISVAVACIATSPAMAADETPAGTANAPQWSLAVAGGSTVIDGGGDQPFLRVAMTRFLDEGYIYAAGTHFAVRDAFGVVDIVPASTWQAAIGGGRTFGKVTLDGYAAIGWRTFKGEEFLRRGGRAITIDSKGKTLSGGLSITYQIDLDERSALSPFVAGDISRIDTARAIEVAGRGTIAQEERQNSTTGSIGFTIDRLVGPEGDHRVEAYGGFVTTSNSAVSIRSSAPIDAARLFGPQDYPGFGQTWGEYGASATLTVAEPLLLDVSAVRTAGFRGGESTNLFAGLRYRF